MACLEVISNDSLYKLIPWEIHSNMCRRGSNWYLIKSGQKK
jgi:hypothetical protein